MKYFSVSASRERGFTLVEMLVVVAILIILAGIAYGQLWRGAEKARDAKRNADLRQLELSLEAYAKSYDRYPSGADGSCTHTTSFGSGGCLEALVETGFYNELPTGPNEETYFYDNWCRETGTRDTKYRAWAEGEGDNNGLAANWWNESTIGVTNCDDPS